MAEDREENLERDRASKMRIQVLVKFTGPVTEIQVSKSLEFENKKKKIY